MNFISENSQYKREGKDNIFSIHPQFEFEKFVIEKSSPVETLSHSKQPTGSVQPQFEFGKASVTLNPIFDDDIGRPTVGNNTLSDLGSEEISSESIKTHIKSLVRKNAPTPHDEILTQLLTQFEPIDFEAQVFPQVESLRSQLGAINPASEQASDLLKKLEKLNLNQKHYLVLSIENVLKVAEKNRWGLCKNQDFIYLYNGAFWAYIDKETFQKFLGEAAEKLGVSEYTAKYYQFREQLLKQFLATGYFPTPEPPKDSVYINLKNGTFKVSSEGTRLCQFSRADFISYQLPFEYKPTAKAPIFQAYLNKILPDPERQKVLAEFLGFVFIKQGSHSLKEEKALILYGSGANGKSVYFEIVNALLGSENVSSYSLQSLTDSTGYYRAMIANKLVNYASEINGNLETSIFKQLVSGEPVEARLPYGRPMQIRQYAKMIFNCNELPKEVEHTPAYFRRFLIIPFDVTIPEADQDKELHSKIIDNELPGVFNWLLAGLNRLLDQKRFSECQASKQAVEIYKNQSDSVKLYLDEKSYLPSPTLYRPLKELYPDYRAFCLEDGFRPVNKTNFMKRLQSIGIQLEKKNIGQVAYLSTIEDNSEKDKKKFF